MVSIRRIAFFRRDDNVRAEAWEERLRTWLKKNHRNVQVSTKNPHAVVVLGGDGTMLEAVRRYRARKTIFLGLNLGEVGFLASVREPQKFKKAIDALLMGTFTIAERMMISAEVIRDEKIVFQTSALNEVVVQNPLGLANLEVTIEGHPIQYIRGSGVIVATATGSTAYNLSAHGPIVMPQIKCLIVTELLDHNIPTPSIVIKHNKNIAITVSNFRTRKLLTLTESKKAFDVLLTADSAEFFALERDDRVMVRRSPQLTRWAEIESNYFFKSLHERFAFR